MSDAGAAIERAKAKTEEMQARAAATDELIQSGTLEDFTLRPHAARPRARADGVPVTGRMELAKMKNELGSGSGSGGDAKQIEGGDGESVSQIHAVPADESAQGNQA